MWSTPFGSIGVAGGTAHPNGVARRAGRSGAGADSRTTSLLPRATTLLTSLNRLAPGARMRGLLTRSRARAKLRAVTGSLDGGENRKPGRTVYVYVRPPSEIAGRVVAASGRSWDPSGAGLSG